MPPDLHPMPDIQRGSGPWPTRPWPILKAFVVRWQHYRAARALSGLSDYMLEGHGHLARRNSAVARRFTRVPR